MAHYLIQFSYTADAIKALTTHPANRFDAVKTLADKFGAKILNAYYAFGEYDGVILVEAPNNQTMSTIAMAAIAAGHLRNFKTTVLLTPEEAVGAMKTAGGVGYQAPR
jgi:uncharacterized protein with GYD domain